MSSKDPINIKTLVEYANGFLISKTLFASCELGIYDVLSQSEVPLSAASVAERLGTNVSGTERLLSACAGLKLLEMDIKDGEGKENANVKKLLEFHHRRPLTTYIGGIGTLAKEFSSMYRGSSIIVYDLPVVVQATQKLSLQEEHICFQQGDFFKDPLPEADLYILSRIMHDWTDDKCLQILKKIYKMCKPGVKQKKKTFLTDQAKCGLDISTSMDLRRLTEYAHSFIISKALFSSCELGIFDLLSQSEMPLSAASVAERLGTNTTGTERLLSACVGLKLLDMDIQNGEAAYKNTELSSLYLTKSSAKSLYPTFMFFSNEVYSLANNLTYAAREGHSQFEKTFGDSSKTCFDSLYRSEEKMISFIHHTDSHWIMSGKEDVLSAFELSSFHTICDLGGGSGALAKDLSSVYPESRFIVFDLPIVVQTVQKYLALNDPRICFQQGDFFQDPLPEADLYIIARVIFAFSEDKCLKLLEKVYNMCKPGGGVLISESILKEDRSGPVISEMFDIILLVCTEGKVRTASQYKSLLEAAGFKDIQFSIKGNLCETILAIK